VLVTGAFGFIGTSLVDSLAADGARVTALGRPGSVTGDEGPSPFNRIDADILDPAFAQVLGALGPDVIFHLAGHSSIQSAFANPAQDLEDNAGTTLALLEAIRAAGGSPVLVFASSSAVYGSGSHEPLREEEAKDSRTPYGASKLCAEAYVTVYARTHGIRAATARLFPLFGPGQRRHVIYDLIAKLTRDPHHLEVIGDGLQTRDLLYISDCIHALRLVASRGDLEGEVYNVSGDVVVTIRELVSAICRHMGVEPEISYTGTFRKGGSDDWIADLTRVRALGYEPQVDLDQGLAETVAWFRKHEAPRRKES
jgi:UDP-glucose 4-epimerase